MIFSLNKSYFIFPMDTFILFAIISLIAAVIAFVFISLKFNRKKTAMVIYLLLWLSFGAVLFCTGAFGKFVDTKDINNKIYTKAELTEDLRQMENRIMNENPLYFTDKDTMSRLFKNTYDKIDDGMTEIEFYRLINPVVTAINCGHTNLSISEALLINRKDAVKFFPLKVTLIENKLYVLEDDLTSGIIAGDEIKSINGLSSEEIINILIKNISGDGSYETKRRYIIQKHFNSRYYDFVDNSDKFEVVLIDREGFEKTAHLNSKYREEFNTTAWELHFDDYKNGDFYSSNIYGDHALLSVRIFMNEAGSKFDNFLEDFFCELREKGISKLIIDLRGNFGADPFLVRTLLSYLIETEIEYFDCDLPPVYHILGFMDTISPNELAFNGDVVVLTDGACFSTTAHLCALIDYYDLGILVGSETGGGYACTDTSKDIALKNTRIRLHYSTLTFKVMSDVHSDFSGIKPQIFASPIVEELLANRDIVMETGIKTLFSLDMGD
ncbi:MAG: S41 family peptidase [Eubacteriales bacterium]